MKTLAMFTTLLIFGAVLLVQQATPQANKTYHVLVDGNELFRDCQSYEDNVTLTADERLVLKELGESRNDTFAAGKCLGYVSGIVDSIPVGEGFGLGPDPAVRGSQCVDVVFAYLRDHPEQRHLPAYELVRTALTQAFPGKVSP